MKTKRNTKDVDYFFHVFYNSVLALNKVILQK